MKKLLSFVAVAVMFVACGSDAPKAGEAPEVVAKKCFDELAKGEVKKFANCFRFESEDEKKNFIEFMERKVRSNQIPDGTKSLETKLLGLFEDRARVKLLATFKSGDSLDKNVDLIKINDTWYIERL
ncbi:DUF4878 domain-containing protein [Campylobacter sp. MG1]|uniref:DUF4878 domain-containing protein n=1 Tax=Campylobacter sp. MG1 TaxID=2976332 RepID=UPI00226D1733|nr:DUF4878 domain-containing protein [Campylobacter sp. MG1]